MKRQAPVPGGARWEVGSVRRSGMIARQTAAARYDQQNEQAANLILGNVERYGGPASLMVTWAMMLLERLQPRIEGPLFQKRRPA